MTDFRTQIEVDRFTHVEGEPPEGSPEVGQVYSDTVLNHGELVEILHVGATAAIIQRPNGVARYPLKDFGPGRRWQLVPAEGDQS